MRGETKSVFPEERVEGVKDDDRQRDQTNGRNIRAAAGEHVMDAQDSESLGGNVSNLTEDTGGEQVGGSKGNGSALDPPPRAPLEAETPQNGQARLDDSSGADQNLPPGQEGKMELQTGRWLPPDTDTGKEGAGTNAGDRRKRKPLLDETDRSSDGKKQKLGQVQCVLTVAVPCWVTKNDTDDCSLHGHLIGKGGSNTKRIAAETNCRLHVFENKTPHISVNIAPFNHRGKVTQAKFMVEELILEYMNDVSSDGRLLYELALATRGSYSVQRTTGGCIWQQNHTDPGNRSGGFVWMKLLELPYFKAQGTLFPHGDFLLLAELQEELKDGTECTIEVYGFDDGIPERCAPYVLVSGRKRDDVQAVAGNVEQRLLKHQSRCSCKFL